MRRSKRVVACMLAATMVVGMVGMKPKMVSATEYDSTESMSEEVVTTQEITENTEGIEEVTEVVEEEMEDTDLLGLTCNYNLTGNVNNYACEVTPVEMHGKLSVSGTNLIDENGTPVRLRGVSLHGIQHEFWEGNQGTKFKDYVNMNSFQILRDEWGVNLIRIPVYTSEGGYCEGKAADMDTTIQNAVNYATSLGMYVIIDWHILKDGNPQKYQSQANTFFKNYASKYAGYNNVLYEICNEPNGVSWTTVKSYATTIIRTIRSVNSDAVIIVGTPDWSQLPTYRSDYKVQSNPIRQSDVGGSGSALASNIMYSIHFYSASHYGNIQQNVRDAHNAGLPIFCTEFSICDASGNGNYDINNANTWMNLLKEYNISYACWNLSNNKESSAMFKTSCKKLNGWTNSDLTTTGAWFINYTRPLYEEELANYTPVNNIAAPGITTSYRTHVQTYGWQAFRNNGAVSGTSGAAKRLEAIELKVDGNNNLGIQYTTHCQSYGWLPWSSNGEMNGTEGEAKRLEAIKIQLTGADKDRYDVYYRVHAQSYGWLGWAKNGAPAGTAGYAKRLEAIQIVIVEKGNVPGTSYRGVSQNNTLAYVAKQGTSPVVGYPVTDATNPVIAGVDTVNVTYRTHVQTYGWQGWKYNGNMSGTSGQAKRLEGINIRLTNKPAGVSGGIRYTTHVQSYGWQGDINNPATWKADGTMAGTFGEKKRLEAICIALYGDMANQYDVYYRVHAQTYGWLNWAKNGEAAGTAGYAKRLEGIQIVLVPKGGNAPDVNYGGISSIQNQAYISK